MKIGVVGGGVVGNATARCWMEYGEVRVYDVQTSRCTHPLVSDKPNQAVLDCDIIFVCLPTPQNKERTACDVSALDNFFKDITTRRDVFPDIVTERCFVIRSTVPIGTTNRIMGQYGLFNIVHSPEFLTARCATTDAQVPARNIIGMPCNIINDASTKLREMYQSRFHGIPCLMVNSDESEAVKLITNGFFSVKVAFFNEAFFMCRRLNLDWQKVMAGVLSDGRIAHSHTKVPGPDGKCGFGGECLPKDLATLIQCIEATGQLSSITSAAQSRNTEDRMKS